MYSKEYCTVYTVLVAELVQSLRKLGLSCCIHNSPFVCCACMHVTTESCRMCNAAWNNLMNDVIRLVMVHGGLLSLNAWKLGPTPQNIEVVASPHSNEPSNRCLLEPAVHEVINT